MTGDAARRRTARRWAMSFIATPLLLYLAVCAAAFFLQTRMLFPAPAALGDSSPPTGAERLALATSDGVTLVGVHFPGRSNDPAAPLVIVFGGNGWNADMAADTVRDFYPETEIVAFHYRGYPPSAGTPSSRALAADSLLVHDFAAHRFPGRRTVAVGFSIGTGIAIHLAAHRPVAGLILVTPFDSLTKVAAAQLPWLPVRLLFRNPLEAASEVRKVGAPVAIVSAGRDEVIPAARTEGLRRAVPRLAYDRTLPHAHHNSIYHEASFAATMREALAAVLGSRP
jgi:pimeloyl-ACP methyl ester carboxylesterase